MAKINKLQKSGVTIYPATIPQAVIDSETGKTQKEVNDDVVEVAKTLKQVEDNASVKIENLVVNGDFREGANRWHFYTASYEILPNAIKVKPTALYGRIVQSINADVAGDKYYISCDVITSTSVGLRTSASPNVSSISSDGVLSGIALAPFSNISVQRTTSEVEPFIVSNVKTINLTETFGAGDEPTKEEFELLLSTLGIEYFEGEITIPAQKIMQWQLALIRKNKNAIIALGGTII